MTGKSVYPGILARAMKAKFIPQKDITAYELAVVVGNIGYAHGLACPPISRKPVDFSDEEWEGLDPSVKRHWVIVD